MLFRSKKPTRKKTTKEMVAELALENGFKVYEIEEYDSWRVKLRLPNGSTMEFPSRNLSWAYAAALEYIKRWTWENKEREIV